MINIITFIVNIGKNRIIKNGQMQVQNEATISDL